MRTPERTKLENELIHNFFYDTRQYRYVREIRGNEMIVKRLPLDKLGTTGAIDGWEEVYRVCD